MKNLIAFIFYIFFNSNSILIAQEKVSVSEIKKGTVLKATDIDFLNIVSITNERDTSLARKDKVAISGKIYSTGDVLSKRDVMIIRRAINEFRHIYKEPDQFRGSGWCCIWYYYCDSDGSKCGTYKYCYVC